MTDVFHQFDDIRDSEATPAPASADAMGAWRKAKQLHDKCPMADMDAPDEIASRIIQQALDQREAAGFRRGVEDAAALWNRHKYNGSFGDRIAALIETQEKG